MPMPYPGIYEMLQGRRAARARRPTARCSSSTLDDAAIDEILARHAAPSSPMAMTQIRILGGAMARVDAGATAFAHRDAAVMVTLITPFVDPAEAPVHQAFTQAYYEALAPAAIGVYANFLEDEGEARIHEAYPDLTYRRLAAGQAPLRPEQPVPPQPEHPTRLGGLTARLPAPRNLRRRRTPSGGCRRLRISNAVRRRSGILRQDDHAVWPDRHERALGLAVHRPDRRSSVSNASWPPKSGRVDGRSRCCAGRASARRPAARARRSSTVPVGEVGDDHDVVARSAVLPSDGTPAASPRRRRAGSRCARRAGRASSRRRRGAGR